MKLIHLNFCVRPRFLATVLLLTVSTTIIFKSIPVLVIQNEQIFIGRQGKDFTDISSKTALVVATEAIMKKHCVVAIQLLNEGYVTMTKSWICNTKYFPGVLDRTLFIATDQTAYDALTRWDATLNVIHIDYTAPKEMSYGQYSYYAFMLFRTQLICYLLVNEVTLWLIESDAIWLRDPSEEVFTTEGDMLTMSDSKPPELNVQGGFQLLRPSKATANVWSKLAKQLEETLTSFDDGDDLGNSGNEQRMLDKLIDAEADLRFAWLDPKRFLCGLYYTEPDYATAANEPKVILNNHIAGNSAKIERAKQNGHWFLNEEGTCDFNATKIVVLQ